MGVKFNPLIFGGFDLKGSSSGGTTSPGGSPLDIQFNNNGVFGGNSKYQWDNTKESVVLNGLEIVPLSSDLTLLNNQTNTTILSYAHADYPFAVLEYSISRGINKRAGRLLLTTNGTTVGFSDDYVDTADLGIFFSAGVNGPNVEIRYTSTDTSNDAVFNYSIRRWS